MSRRKVKSMDREQEKAMFWRLAHPLPVTKKRVINKMKQRSKRARSMDRTITAKQTYDIRSMKGRKKWMKHPERTDIRGVDTALGKQQYKARIRKKEFKIRRKHIKKLHKEIHRKKQETKRKEELIKKRKKVGEKLYKLRETTPVKDRAYYEKREPLQKEAIKIQEEIKKVEIKEIKPEAITEKDLKEIEQIQKEIEENNRKYEELDKQKKKEEEELKKLEAEHVESKAIIRETREGKGYYSMSQHSIDQINKLTPKQERELKKDVDEWITVRQKEDSEEAKNKLQSIRNKYKVDSPQDAYWGITGVNPYRYIHDKPIKREKIQPSPAGLELENTVRLSKLKNTIYSVEPKIDSLKYMEKENKHSVEYIKAERDYNKYIEKQRELVKTLKEDPNVTISTKLSKHDHKPIENHSDVILEYKGNYVTATKKISSVRHDVLNELNIHHLKG